jgi:hypothetical protein
MLDPLPSSRGTIGNGRLVIAAFLAIGLAGRGPVGAQTAPVKRIATAVPPSSRVAPC